MNRRSLAYSCLSLAAFLLLTAPTRAQLVRDSAPDLGGLYTGRTCLSGNGEVCPELSLEGAQRVLTARARALAEAFDELAAPKYDCGPATLPGLFGDPYTFLIEQFDDRVVFTYEKDDIVRTIWLDGHGNSEPRAGEFFVHGYAEGRYVGDELVVATTKFLFDPAGLAGDYISAPSSTQKRLIERYSLDGDNLRMALTVEDSIFLLVPIEYEMQWRPTEGPLSLPWNCDPVAAQRNLRLRPTKYPEDPPIVRRN